MIFQAGRFGLHLLLQQDGISRVWCVSALRQRHNGHDSVSNHQPHDCLLSRLFRCRSKKTSNSSWQASVQWNHQWPVNSLHKGPVTWKMLPFDDVIMCFTMKTRQQPFIEYSAVQCIIFFGWLVFLIYWTLLLWCLLQWNIIILNGFGYSCGQCIHAMDEWWNFLDTTLSWVTYDIYCGRTV